MIPPLVMCFFFNHTATTEIYTLSLHDALPIWAKTTQLARHRSRALLAGLVHCQSCGHRMAYEHGHARYICKSHDGDRKSTRLNSSHMSISYAVFCLKKKKSKVYELCPTVIDVS